MPVRLSVLKSASRVLARSDGLDLVAGRIYLLCRILMIVERHGLCRCDLTVFDRENDSCCSPDRTNKCEVGLSQDPKSHSLTRFEASTNNISCLIVHRSTFSGTNTSTHNVGGHSAVPYLCQSNKGDLRA